MTWCFFMAISGGVGMGWPGFKRHRWFEGSAASAPLQSFSFVGLFSFWFSICRRSCSNSATWKVWGQGVGQYYVALLVGNHGSSAKTAAGVS